MELYFSPKQVVYKLFSETQGFPHFWVGGDGVGVFWGPQCLVESYSSVYSWPLSNTSLNWIGPFTNPVRIVFLPIQWGFF